jgi:cupin 2 domain-containing protein
VQGTTGHPHSHGRLDDGTHAPAEGETATVLARAHGFTVEQILSGRPAAPQAYVQDHDEWVVVLAGGATLEVDGVEHELTVGDWWLLPAGTAHTLVRTEPGTSWLAVRSAR